MMTKAFWSAMALVVAFSLCAMAADEIDPTASGYFTVLRYEWTSDGSGNATGLASAPSPGLMYMAVTIPATGGDQPSDDYDIVVKERYAAPGSGTVLLSTDLAGGALVNRDNVATERVEVWPDVWKQVGGYLQIEVSNAGAAKQGVIEIHIFRTLAFRMFDLGDSVGEGLPIGGAVAQMLQNNGNGEAKWITMSGDVTIADGGATTLQINTEAAWETHTGLDWYTENDTDLVLSTEIDSEAELEAMLLDTANVVTNNDSFYQYFIDSAGTAGQFWASDGVGKGTWVAAPGGADDMGSVDTEAELESALTDVSDVMTNNDATYRPILLTATGATFPTANGADGPTQIETSTYKNIFYTVDFDKDADEYAYWTCIALPYDYKDGTALKVQINWTAIAGTSGGVQWFIGALALANDEALDTDPNNNELGLVDTFIAQKDLHSTACGDLTILGTPAAGELLMLYVYRDVSDDDDTFDADANLISVEIAYQAEFKTP